jgi:PAS domain S-box-containing protein
MRMRSPGTTEDRDVLFCSVADHAPVMLWLADLDGEFSFFNKCWLDFTGRRLDEVLGRRWLEAVHAEDRDRVAEAAQQAFRARRPFTLEYRLRRADGEYRWVRGHGSLRLDEAGRPCGYVGSYADVTEIKDRHAAVTEAESRFHRLIETAQDFVYRRRLFPTRGMEYMGGAVEAITGHTPAEFYADVNLAARSVHPDDVPLLDETLGDPARLKSVMTLRWIHADGRVVWAEHRRAPVYDSAGNFVAIDGIARDVTERVKVQQRLRESQEQMRRLAARLQSAREEERATRARELHDDLGQTLTAIKLDLARATAALGRDRIAVATVNRLQSLIGLVEIGIASVKRISTNLRPPTLDHLGLPAAIRWEAVAFRARTGLRCHIRAQKETTALSGEQQTAVFRIFQEALTNVVRHARASAVHVTLAERQGTFELRIRDNGCGITDEQIGDPRAIGLLGMRERAALIGGTFEIAGRRGKGTVVAVRVPTGTGVSRPAASRPRTTGRGQ